jgi:hypothetical protein
MIALMKLRFWVATILLLLIASAAAHMGVKKASHNRCAREGEAAVVRFLQGGGAFTNKGAFRELEGAGFNYPVWNIQGYEFLDLHRTAYFSNGAQDIRIIVREGNTSDGKIGQPKVDPAGNSYQAAMIFVTHPGFRP